jgi:excisionase family DNA binding protein
VEKLLTISEIATATGLSPVTLYKRSSKGELPGKVRLGGRAVRFRQSAIEAWIERGVEKQKLAAI